MLNNIVQKSNIEEVNTYVANFLKETFGITLDQDPYGQNNSIELNEAGLIPMEGCETNEFKQSGEWSDMLESGVWNKNTGNLAGGFISVDSMNDILDDFSGGFDKGIKSIHMKKDGKVAKMMVDFN